MFAAWKSQKVCASPEPACGETQYSRGADSIRYGLPVWYGSGHQGEEKFITRKWIVYWYDGYERPVDVEGKGVRILGTEYVHCNPTFRTPTFVDHQGVGCWEQTRHEGFFNPDSGGCSVAVIGTSETAGHRCGPMSPILIDIAGNNFNLTDVSRGVTFDMKGDGSSVHVAWTSANSDDAFLALDRNGDGQINDGKELFGNYTPQTKTFDQNGFLALAEYDKAENGGNNDEEITSIDSIFPSLRLWQDTNHNGVSEATELKTLSALGIAKMELNYKESKRTDEHGNQFRYRAKVKDVHGAQVGRWAWDVFFAYTD